MSTRTRDTGKGVEGGAQVVRAVRPLEVGRSIVGRPTLNLVHSRHYVRNYFDLFRDIFDRIYAAGGVTNTVRIEPGDTVGEALNLTEAGVAAALADESAGESAVLSLIRTIAEDQGTDPADADLVRDIVQLALAQGHPTFATKADALETGLQGMVNGGTITQAQLDQMVRVFRGVGGVIADALAFEFPALDDERIDLDDDPEKYILISGTYHAKVPADPHEFFSISFANDRITLEIALDEIEIHASTDFEFYKVKNNGNVKEKHEMVMGAIGALVFRDIKLSLELDDALGDPTVYTWAPGHDVRRAEWTKPAVTVNVGSVDLDIAANAATVLLAFYEWHWTVAGLEDEWADLIRDSINGRHRFGPIGDILNEYVTPIAQRIIPISHALSRVRYGWPYEAEGLVTYRTFDEVETRYESRCVSLRNEQPEGWTLEPYENPVPGDLPEWDGDPELHDWVWASTGPGGVRPQLDLDLVQDRATAVGFIENTPGLAEGTRALAALSVEGFTIEEISALKPAAIDVKAGTVAGRPVGAGTVRLLRAAEKTLGQPADRDFLLPYDGSVGRQKLLRADLAGAKLRIAGTSSPIDPATPSIPVPEIDDGVWRRDYADDTPLLGSRGEASDPGWIGLSTNCALATGVYRAMRAAGVFAGEGATQEASTGDIRYELRGCGDAAADFTGMAPGGAPGLAIRDLVIAVGPAQNDTLATYRATLRIRLEPVIHGRGCLPDIAVTTVSDSLDCIETMIGAAMPEEVRLRQVAYRDFVFLRPNVAPPGYDIEVPSIVIDRNDLVPGDVTKVRAQIRAALLHWLPVLPEVPVLYNSFRPVGGETRDYVTKDGWLAVYRRYPFPDLGF